MSNAITPLVPCLNAPEVGGCHREAAATIFDNGTNTAFAVTLDVTAGVVAAVHQAPAGSQPTMTIDEQIECEQAVLASPAHLVEVDLLDGRRETLRVPVVALIEDYFGLRGMMELGALNRTLRESASADAASSVTTPPDPA